MELMTKTIVENSLRESIQFHRVAPNNIVINDEYHIVEEVLNAPRLLESTLYTKSGATVEIKTFFPVSEFLDFICSFIHFNCPFSASTLHHFVVLLIVYV